MWIINNLSNLLLKLIDNTTTKEDKQIYKDYILSLAPHEVYQPYKIVNTTLYL